MADRVLHQASTTLKAVVQQWLQFTKEEMGDVSGMYAVLDGQNQRKYFIRLPHVGISGGCET